MDSAKNWLALLFSDIKEEAAALAKELHELNIQRKDITQQDVERAIEYIYKMLNDEVLVVYIPETEGTIAGRIREKYNLPTIILMKVTEGVKGSGRSIEGYNIFEKLNLNKCKELLGRFGARPMAVWLSLEESNAELLRKNLNTQSTLIDEDVAPKIYLDMQLPLEKISYDLIKDIATLNRLEKEIQN